MKKPANFDKIDKIKFSDLQLVNDNYAYHIDIRTITLYNASLKNPVTKRDVYHHLSHIVLIDGPLTTTRASNATEHDLVIRIEWESQIARACLQDSGIWSNATPHHKFRTSSRNLIKRFNEEECITMQSFIQVVILPITIEAIRSRFWITTAPF
jgi:hypothetical protein